MPLRGGRPSVLGGRGGTGVVAGDLDLGGRAAGFPTSLPLRGLPFGVLILEGPEFDLTGSAGCSVVFFGGRAGDGARGGGLL